VLWSGIGDDVALAANLIEAAASGWHRLKYDLKKFSRERAATEIETLYRHVVALRKTDAKG